MALASWDAPVPGMDAKAGQGEGLDASCALAAQFRR
jgi:hypothetical protein